MNKQCFVALGLTMALITSSCSPAGGGATEAQAVEAVTAAGLTVDVVERAITLSHAGKLDVSVALLLEGTESDETAVEIAEHLGRDESSFRGLTEPELSQAQQENMGVGKAARALARAAMEKAAEARAQGDGEKAAQWLQRVDAMGKLLSSTKYNKMLRLQGDAVSRDAGDAGT